MPDDRKVARAEAGALMTQAEALGLDLDDVARRIGIDVDRLRLLLARSLTPTAREREVLARGLSG